jgi:hypothetical protein
VYTNLVLRGAAVDIGAAIGSTYRKIIDVSYGALIINQDSNDVDFRVESNNNPYMLFMDAGNDKIGIGTNTPYSTLDVSGIIRTCNYVAPTDGSGLELFYTPSNGFGYVQSYDRNADAYTRLSLRGSSIIITTAIGSTTRDIIDVSYGAVIINEDSNDVDFRIESNDDANMFFVDGGNNRIGMGTATPLTDLDIRGDASIIGQLTIYSDTTGAYTTYINQEHASGHGLRIDVDGATTSQNIIAGYSLTTNVANLRADGTWWAADYVLSSDISLKDNIEIVKNGLEIALALKPVNFTWKDKRDDFNHIGFISQDIEKVRPELVSHDANGLGSVSYTKISAINNAAIHELYKKIQELEDRIKQLENGKYSS